MATDSDARSVTNTLSTTTADTVTLLQSWPAIAVTNYDSADIVYFRQDGVTAVGAANGCTVVMPGTTVTAAASPRTANGQIVVSIVGDGGTYTIEGVN